MVDHIDDLLKRPSEELLLASADSEVAKIGCDGLDGAAEEERLHGACDNARRFARRGIESTGKRFERVERERRGGAGIPQNLTRQMADPSLCGKYKYHPRQSLAGGSARLGRKRRGWAVVKQDGHCVSGPESGMGAKG